MVDFDLFKFVDRIRSDHLPARALRLSRHSTMAMPNDGNWGYPVQYSASDFPSHDPTGPSDDFDMAGPYISDPNTHLSPPAGLVPESPASTLGTSYPFISVGTAV